jgi:hypothetical protein
MGPPCTSNIAQNLEKLAMRCTSHDVSLTAAEAPGWALKKVISPNGFEDSKMALGSSSDQPLSVDSESTAYPDFKVYHRPAPDDRLASKKNYIEQNFFILKRIKRSNRTDDIECQCALCSISFKAFNTTQMRVHLTGESQGTIRVAARKNVHADCKEFYLAGREREAAKTREKEAARTSLYNQAAPLSKTKTEKKRKAAEEEHSKDANPRTLSMPNFKHVSQIPITSMMVKYIFFQYISLN